MSPKNAYIGYKIRSTCGDHPDGVFWTKSGQFGPSDDHFRGQKARFRTILGLKTACLLMKWPFGIPRGAPKVQKWVSDTYPVNITHLDHYVVFGTQLSIKKIVNKKNGLIVLMAFCNKYMR